MTKRVIVVLPAYNTANTLARTLANLDRSHIDEIIVCDDAGSINLRRSVVYALAALGVFAKWYAHRFSPYRCPLFTASSRTALSGS